MRTKTAWIIGAATTAVVLGGATVAVAADGLLGPGNPVPGVSIAPQPDDDSHDSDADDAGLAPLTGGDRDQAASAALARVGQGSVTEVERENDGSTAYEVKVRLDDGRTVEVQLGADFQVLAQGAPETDD